MKLNIYQVDAFAESVFSGNPAAVCPLQEWIDADLMQKIAAENNLSETAFYVRGSGKIEIRWFTPAIEVDLCGHATLAAAFVLSRYEAFNEDVINFYSSRSGNLPVTFRDGLFMLNFPTDKFEEIELSDELLSATNKIPVSAYRGNTDYMLVFENQDDIRTMQPNLPLIAGLKARGIIVTAKGIHHDFVSRFFAPAAGVNEDPVCGSAHTTLIPYWAGRLNKNTLTALQLSSRRGELHCRLLNDRIELGGKAVMYMKGEIFV